MATIPADGSAEAFEWEEAVAEFRALGGKIENICRKLGQHGYGLHLQTPEEPWALFVPENLLIPTKDVVFDGGTLRLGPSSTVGAREQRFFERYQAQHSWGATGRVDSENHFATLRGLPGAARAFLVKRYNVLPSAYEVPAEAAIGRRFIDSRSIHYGSKRVLMPILELLNYGSEGILHFEKGISVRGVFSDEVLVSYGRMDPIRVFINWGFAASAPNAFSLPLIFRSGGLQVGIVNRFELGTPGKAMFVPNVAVRDNRLIVSHVWLGSRKSPRQPRSVFIDAMREAGVERPASLFNEIVRRNRLEFLELLGHVENEEGRSSAILRSVIRHQLTALSEEIPTQE